MKKFLLVLSFLFMSVAGFSQDYRYVYFQPTYYDGFFFRNNITLAVYIVFEGNLRFIQTIDTLNGLFVGAHNLIIDVPPSVLNTYPVGTPVSTASGFMQVNGTGPVYLREGTLLRWVSSVPVSQKYHFNLSITQFVSNTNGYTIGPPITQ
jgi:hypothetical protein